MKRITGFFLALVMVMGFLPLNPTVSYANDSVNGDAKIKIDDIHFQDANFRKYVSDRSIDENGDGYLTKDELDKVKKISIIKKSVSSLKGIEHFKNLETLDCSDNKLTSLDLSHNTDLSALNCSLNKLTSLDLSHNTDLSALNCSSNHLTSLDVSKNTGLVVLYCGNQQYDIIVDKNTRKFEYSKFPGQFKKEKATIQSGATFNDDALTVDSNTPKEVTYKYKVSDTREMDVKLNVTYFDPGNGDVEINDKNFPDKKFRDYVSRNFDGNKKGYLTKTELDSVTKIDIRHQSVSDLKGIEHFKNLTELDCSYNNLTSLDVSNNTKLEKLHCHNNQLEGLDLSKNTKLTALGCSDNKLTSLNVSKNTKLITLICFNNRLTSLNVSNNTELTKLSCSENKLEGLDISKNAKLITLSCSINNLTSLNVSNTTELTTLWCAKNNLTSLNVSKNKKLTELSCHHNNLTSLDVSKNTKLTQLRCSNQQYNITVDKGKREFEYSKFPGQFKKEKATIQSGATFNDDALTVDSNTPKEVTYKYKVSDTREMDVKLNVTYIEFNPAPRLQPEIPAPKPQPKTPAPIPAPKPQSETPAPKPEVKPQSETPAPKPQPETSAPKLQPEKHSGMMPQTGESASFEGLLAALGFSIAELAILRKKKMMKGNNK